ncbi:toll-like receptor 4 [Diadema antillarum]|uniref:toll-like receptor 4 n=1 Tax=Diadema antillarum TaxID=105358 RepID=UPI003A8C5193
MNDFAPLTTANISRMKMSRNNIVYISYGTFERLKHVKQLDLDNNNLKDLTLDAFLGMDSLEYLNLNISNIVRIRGFRSNTTLRVPPLFAGKSILEFNPDKACGPNLTVYITASTLVLSCIIGSVLAWRNRWWLNYKCFHLRLLIIGYYEMEDAREHQDYRYDLNIIFPDEDEGWVLEEFMLAVQEHLPDFPRNRIVCGDDDLPLGSTRFDAIDRVIENSFKNLVIVSNASVDDANYLMMLQMAVAHMNDVQLENVVMVFREDIPDNQLPYLVRLFLSKNKPYFQWSEERYQEMLFWERLAKTLTRNKKINGVLPL